MLLQYLARQVDNEDILSRNKVLTLLFAHFYQFYAIICYICIVINIENTNKYEL